MAEIAAEEKTEAQEPQRRPNAFQLALLWHQEMKEDPKLNKAKIAVREGISRARVTQIMNLLELPAAIQNDLLRLPAPLEINSFPERQLRNIVRCGTEEAQINRWQELLRELMDSGGE